SPQRPTEIGREALGAEAVGIVGFLWPDASVGIVADRCRSGAVFGYRFGVLRRRRPAVGARFPGLPRFGLVDCRWVRLARALATLGHWRDLPPSVAADQQREIARGGYPFTGAAFDEVTFPADGEDLAEGGVEELLERMRPVLQRHGVALQVATLSTAESIDDDYVIAINGRRCLVLGPDDWRYE